MKKATKRNGKWKFTAARRAAAKRNIKKAQAASRKPCKARKTAKRRTTSKRRR